MGEHTAPGSLSAAGAASALHLRTFDASSYAEVLPAVAAMYEAVYQEPPYREGPDDVRDFVESMPRRVTQPAFRLVVAYDGTTPVGFAFGHQLPHETKWWNGATQPLPSSFTEEPEGRTFAIIELAVIASYRRRRIAKALHNSLLLNRTEERVTLLVRPEAKPANAAYESWGYTTVASVRPWPTAPLYTAMVHSLRHER